MPGSTFSIGVGLRQPVTKFELLPSELVREDMKVAIGSHTLSFDIVAIDC